MIARPRVLYVIGFGRSGSTVLCMALGRHPAIFNVGEFVSMPTFIAGANMSHRERVDVLSASSNARSGAK